MQQLRNPSIKNDVLFHQDGIVKRYKLAVKEYLREVFSDCELADGHLCRPFHLNYNLNAQIRHQVIIQFWVFHER